MDTSSEIILETKLVGSISGKFIVPSYQRGYRWGPKEVTRLLDDIKANGDQNYCLQPIVVRKNGDFYELIDGQQRLTTLLLIYKFMKAKGGEFMPAAKYSISYETRKLSEQFLEDLNPSMKNDNIDFWFMSQAYEEIERWFEEKGEISTYLEISSYLEKAVKVIWYEVASSEDPIALFTRLNIGKIPLTSAELVKAMFLSGDAKNMSRERQEEISLQWDSIERELHDDSLWYFLTNETEKENYQTRIDLVLDLIARKPKAAHDNYYTFFKFDEIREKEDLLDVWKRITRTFLVLKDWYEDHTLYHKIGYLIASGHMTLMGVYDIAQDKKKTEFAAALDDEISKSIYSKENYTDLSYETSSGRRMISRLLLLFNVESVRKIDKEAQRFPFDKYKDQRNNICWSLEHIHAQNSESLKTVENWHKWLELHIPSVEAVESKEKPLKELLEKMKNALNNPKLQKGEFEEISAEAIDVLSPSGSREYINSISNMALLNTSDNAALNNSTFDVKRNEIVRMDMRGQFIPFCTKMVFLKYYTPSKDNQVHFWGQADRTAYIKAINEVLRPYLNNTIETEGN